MSHHYFSLDLFVGKPGRLLSQMFQGEYKNTMDGKGRINIPASFRETLRARYADEHVIVTRDYDGCLRAYPPKEWEQSVLASVRRLDINDPYRRSYERYVVSPAVSCLPDKQGRILLPATLREYAELDKTVLFAGGANHFEIWDIERRKTRIKEDLAILKKGPPSC